MLIRSLILFLFGFHSSMTAQVIVFVDESEPVDSDFIDKYYPKINEAVRALDLEIVKIDVRTGAPKEITVTPQLVFQNDYGRSFYMGRYSEISRFKTFLRTVARNPQQAKPNIKNNILAHQSGRSTTVLPLKITTPTGDFKEDINGFYQRASGALNQGFEKFNVLKNVNLERTNRSFYLDVHPYFSSDGNLYLSYEIYSQFNCVIPIFSRLEEPLIEKSKDMDLAFERLGMLLETKVLELREKSDNGDGFSPIDDSVILSSWTDYGLQEFKDVGISNGRLELPDFHDDWVVAGAIDKITPVIQFNFHPPLDSYAGEVKELNGSMSWVENRLFGQFLIATGDVTMGEESYDKNVHRKYIKVKKYPIASFRFKDFILERADLINGEPSMYLIPGMFSFMGKEQIVNAITRITPFKNETGSRLLVNAEFNLNIFNHSKVDGPNGPKEARENMHFQLNFEMKKSSVLTNNNKNSK